MIPYKSIYKENVLQWKDKIELMSYNDAIKYCKTLGSGWRLPTVKELMSINDSKFKNHIMWTQSNYYLPYEHRWIIDMDDKSLWSYNINSEKSYSVIFVKGVIQDADPIEVVKNVEWESNTNNPRMTKSKIEKYIKDLYKKTKVKWRLPSCKELQNAYNNNVPGFNKGDYLSNFETYVISFPSNEGMIISKTHTANFRLVKE
jgi:hypothetical protein